MFVKTPPSSSRAEIISRMQFLTLEVATQKAETRISCNTIATWSSYLERNADIDNCLETGLGLVLGLGLGADASPLEVPHAGDYYGGIFALHAHCTLLLDYVPPEEPPSTPLGNALRIR